MAAANISIRWVLQQPASQTYDVWVHEDRVLATVTRSPSTVRRWLYGVRHVHARRYYQGDLVVGLGVQWRFDRRNAGKEPVATIQLCVGRRCLIFQVLRAPAIPNALSRFLADPNVICVNVGIRYDMKKLEEHCGIHVFNGLELRKRAGMGNASLQDMACEFLGWELDYQELKPQEVGLSNWEAWLLDEAQVMYACMDVYCSFLLELRFREN